MSGVLEGVVVLDLTQVLAGPFCTMMLADHGADVIKIEPPEGDISRGLGPFYAHDAARQHGGYFHSVNRNKRSIVLDLKNDKDRTIFLDLAAKADVVVENFRTGVMDRLGFSYETLAARNPRLVYAAIRGFGDPRTGESPYASWPAFDIVAQAMSGFMSITGPGRPMKAGPGIGDIVPGIMLAFGIVAALRHAERSGQGQFLDVAMYDAMLSICERIVHQHSVTGLIPTSDGNHHPIVCPFSIFEASDGWVAIACTLESQWVELAHIMGRADLLEDPRLTTNPLRVQHVDIVAAAISQWASRLTRRQVAECLGGRVPFGPVNNVADIMADPHIAARGMIAEVELPELARTLSVAGVPVHFAATPGTVRQAGPKLGEHTGEVMTAFGIAREPTSGKSN
jgi:crotonobetainyl-CoA:carnitine CoA-transferase CaiB-like acyl-CoA transferase